MDSGTVYGPPPTRNRVAGGEMITCAEPMPGDVIGAPGAGAAGDVVGCVTGGAGVAGSFAVAGGLAGAGVGTTGVTTTVPGTGEEPGGCASNVPPGPTPTIGPGAA